jgi:type II secretory pathway component PulF
VSGSIYRPPAPAPTNTLKGKLLHLYARISFDTNTRVETYREMMKLLESSLTTLQAIGILHKRSSRKSKTDGTALVLAEVWHRFSNGQATGIGAAFGPWIPAYEKMLLSAGDKAGKPQEALELCIRVVTGSQRMTSAIRKGTIYPGLLFGMLCAVAMAFNWLLMPKLAAVSDPELWEGSAAMVRDFASFVDNYIILILGGLIGLGVAANYSLNRLTGPIRRKLDKLPPWSVFRISRGATFLVSLAALLQANRTIKEGLSDLSREAPPYLKEVLAETLKKYEEGVNLGEALDATGMNFPSPDVIDRLMIFATLKNFSQELMRIGEANMISSVEEVEKLMAKIKVLMIALVGIMVSIMMSGIFSLQGQIAGQAEQMMR